MADLTIYGASDDLVEIEGVAGADEYNAEDVRLLVTCPDGRAAEVHVAYVSGGVWAITYQPSDEDVEAPEGRIDCNGYTARLTLDVPDGTKVHRLADVAA